MVGRLFAQLGVPADALRRYARGGGGGGGSGGGGGGGGLKAGVPSRAAGAAAVEGAEGAAGGGRQLRREAWFRGVADPTGKGVGWPTPQVRG